MFSCKEFAICVRSHSCWLGNRCGGLGCEERSLAPACGKVCLLSGVILASSIGSRVIVSSDYRKTSCWEALPWAGRLRTSSQIRVGSESLRSVGGTWKTDEVLPFRHAISLLWNICTESSLRLGRYGSIGSLSSDSKAKVTAGDRTKRLSVLACFDFFKFEHFLPVGKKTDSHSLAIADSLTLPI